MDFKTRNDFIVRYTSEGHFEVDKKLFLEKCKPSQLHNDLSKVNRFNRKQFDGRIIAALLNAGVTPEDILANRKGAPADNQPEGNAEGGNTPEAGLQKKTKSARKTKRKK